MKEGDSANHFTRDKHLQVRFHAHLRDKSAQKEQKEQKVAILNEKIVTIVMQV